MKKEREFALRRAHDKDDHLRILKASQKERAVEPQWTYLCTLEDGHFLLGATVERVYFGGPVEGFHPGTYEGLPTRWRPDEDQWAYHLALHTTEKILTADLTGDADLLQTKLRREGYDAAARIHDSWHSYLDEVILEVHEDQGTDVG